MSPTWAGRVSDLLLLVRVALSGRYSVEHPIGRGGMGTVFLAQDLRHHRPVAIKVLRPELAATLGPERFLREIEIAASLTHPHLLPLHDSGTADGLLFCVMPYVEGESLRARLQRERQLPLGDALGIAREVADALSYAHGRGIVHRDIKPENILLEAGHAVVADFGVARALTIAGADNLTEPGLAVGTPAYMSPEQAGGSVQIDGRSDLYALGCVLYEMLAGDPPFTGSTPRAVLARHLHEEPPRLRIVRPAIPARLEEVIETALAKVPADRFATPSQFIAALNHASVATSTARNRRAARVATFATLGVLAGIGGYRFARQSGRSPPAEAARAQSPAPSNIAVLYFDDRSRDRQLDYLATGLTEDLIDQLAAVKSLRVISPDGVRPYRGRNVPLDSLARVFHLGTIVTGSVSRSSGRLRASVRLTDAVNGVQLFSGSFEKPFGDLLILRDNLADEVARQLRVRLGEAVQLEERRSGTRNALAWELVRQAEKLRGQAQGLTVEDSSTARSVVREADSLLVRAESLDPSWAEPTSLRGWLAYDEANRVSGESDSAGSASSTWIRRGIALSNRALQKSSGNPEALELRGSLRYRGWALTSFSGARDTSGQLEQAERDLRQAANSPQRHQARALSTLSTVLQFLGKPAEANLAAQRAYDADAYLRDANVIVLRLFDTSLQLKRYPQAAEWCERGRRTFPRDWTFLMCQLTLLAWSPGMRPDIDHAWNVLAELDTVADADVLPWARPQMAMIVAAVLGRAGLADSAEQVIARANAAGKDDPELLYYEALARTRLGQRALAARLLEQFLRKGPNFEPFVRRYSLFESVWSDSTAEMSRSR